MKLLAAMLLLVAAPLAAQKVKDPVDIPIGLQMIVQESYRQYAVPTQGFCAYGTRTGNVFHVTRLTLLKDCEPEKLVGLYVFLPTQPPQAVPVLMQLACRWMDGFRAAGVPAPFVAIYYGKTEDGAVLTAGCYDREKTAELHSGG